MKPPLVISLCDFTANAVKPWAKAGYECWCVDIQHPPGFGLLRDNVRLIGLDILRFVPPTNRKIAFVFAFPPCTHLAVSGARWFSEKGLFALSDAIRLVAQCDMICQSGDAPYLIENPVGTLASYWRQPDHSFDPCDYAGYLNDPAKEAYTKRTCLWTGNFFKMPPPKPVKPFLGSKMHKLPPSADRANKRSATPRGFARAVFIHNDPRTPDHA